MINLTPKTWKQEDVVAELLSTKELNIFALKNNIIVSEYIGDVEIDIDHILSINEIIRIYTNGVPAKHLYIVCPELYINAEARKFGVSDEIYQHVVKAAIVCDNLAHRIIGNFVIKAKRLSKPTKMFADTDEALEWLREM